MALGEIVLILVVYVLAVARVTRLINADAVADRLRVWVAGRARHHYRVAAELQPHADKDESFQHHRRVMRRWDRAAYFLSCPWCVGMWIGLAGAGVVVVLVGWPAWAVLPVGLACSHLVGVFAFTANTEDIDITDEDAD